MLNGIPTANDGSWQTQHFGAAQQSSPYFDPAIYGGDPHEFEDDYYVEPAPSIVPTRVFGGGGRWIRGLAVDTPTNSLLVSGDDARIRIWDLVTGQLRRTLRGHKAPVYSLAVDGTNGLVYSGGMDGMLLAHDPRTKQPVAKFELHDDSVRSLVLRRDGAKFYSAGYDGRLAEWDPRKGTPRVLVKPGHAKAGWLRSLALDPSQQHLYYISDTALACIHILSASTLWTQRTETPLRTLHLDYAGRFLYTGGQDSAIIQWDALNGAPQGSLNSHRGWVTSLATHPAEPRRLFSVSLDTTIKEWDLARGTLTTTWEPKAGPVENLVLDPEGRPRMWTTGWGAGVGEWRVPDGWWLEDGDGV